MDVLQATREYVMRPAGQGRTAEIAKSIQARFAFALMDLGDSQVSANVKARTDTMLRLVRSDLRRPNSGHGDWLVTKIDAYLNKPAQPEAAKVEAKQLPPGGPIGMGDYETCWHCDPF